MVLFTTVFVTTTVAIIFPGKALITSHYKVSLGLDCT